MTGELTRLIKDVAIELASMLDRGAVPRKSRPAARKLLMKAYLMTEDPKVPDPDPAQARRVAAAMDRLVAGSPSCPPIVPVASRFPWPVRVRAVPDRDPESMLRTNRIGATVDFVLRRIEFMVNKCEDAGRRAGLVAEVKPSPGATREELELVWAENEE